MTAMPDKCPKCGVPWTLGRDVGGRVHTPDGIECLRQQLYTAQGGLMQCKDLYTEVKVERDELRRQVAALREALRDVCSGIDGIEQGLQYGDIESVRDIVRLAQQRTSEYPRSWFVDAEVSGDD